MGTVKNTSPHGPRALTDGDVPRYPGLSELQSRLLYAWLYVPGCIRNGTAAALWAGYSENGAAVRASELLRRDDVQAIVQRESQRALKEKAHAAVEVLSAIMLDETLPATTRLQAATVVIDRSGLKPAEKIEISETYSPDERRKRIAELQAALGIQQARVINGETIETVPEPVTAEITDSSIEMADSPESASHSTTDAQRQANTTQGSETASDEGQSGSQGSETDSLAGLRADG